MLCKTPAILKCVLIVIIFGSPAFGDCPSADLTGDCFVDFGDFATGAIDWSADDFNDFAVLASQWLTGGFDVAADMAFVPGGTFEMGDNLNDGGSAEKPVHSVTIDSFFMGKYEISNAQYCEFLNSAKSRGLISVMSGVVYKAGTRADYPYCSTSTSRPYSQIAYAGGVFTVRTKGGRDMSDDPVVEVSWHGAAAYCNWRSRQEGYEQCYDLAMWTCDFSKIGYRLATEAEWEYAARGGLSGRRFPPGDTISHSQANYYSSGSLWYDISATKGYHSIWNDGVFPYTSPAGSFAANLYGLHDMAGNVWEWCNDRYSSSYYSISPSDNPTGPSEPSADRVLRGGSWYYSNARRCRVAYRTYSRSVARYYSIGFRIVLPY